MNNKDIMFKEIDIIQSIIARMGSNSFLIKGWTITLTVGIVALDKFNENNRAILLGLSLFSIFVFWLLDAYYLQQEKLYRKLYKWVVENREESDKYVFDMDIERVFGRKESFLNVMFSKTVWPLYTLLIAFLLVFGYVNFILVS